MPLREYVCDGCRHAFEELVSDGEQPRCPECGGKRLTRRLSAFAVAAPGRRSGPREQGPCGSCGDARGPGACSLDD
ncbi:MAG TPA: zinc ribbon domain-containing protein [Thermoanaerobaculia bacterium]|nr:zinc ribbon domain-containing protein [Thermoanaerobaculia bacterium]